MVDESILAVSNLIACPFCNNQIEAKAFFCPICGKKVREKPVSMGFWSIFLLFILCIFLPPLNIGLTIKYMKSADPKAKKIGIASLVVMLVVLVAAGISTYYLTKYISDQVNTQVTQQLKMMQGTGY
jgi:hypothetical protein